MYCIVLVSKWYLFVLHIAFMNSWNIDDSFLQLMLSIDKNWKTEVYLESIFFVFILLFCQTLHCLKVCFTIDEDFIQTLWKASVERKQKYKLFLVKMIFNRNIELDRWGYPTVDHWENFNFNRKVKKKLLWTNQIEIYTLCGHLISCMNNFLFPM